MEGVALKAKDLEVGFLQDLLTASVTVASARGQWLGQSWKDTGKGGGLDR